MIIYVKCFHVRGGVLYCMIDFRTSFCLSVYLSLRLRSESSLKLIILRENLKYDQLKEHCIIVYFLYFITELSLEASLQSRIYKDKLGPRVVTSNRIIHGRDIHILEETEEPVSPSKMEKRIS